MHKYDFRLSSEDKNVGTVYLPSKNSLNLPVIIFCPGWGGSRELWGLAKILCDRAMKDGIAFVSIDFFGCGETGGDYRNMTYTRWKNNLSEFISWIELQPFANKNIIGCYAFSSGSTAALRLAAEDERIAFIISVGTALSAHIGMGQGGPSKILVDNLQNLMAGGTVSLFNVDFGLDFYLDTVSKAPINSMHGIKCPVLFLQGTRDNPYRCADAKMGYDLLKRNNPITAYFLLEDAAHGLGDREEDALDIIFDWLPQIIR